MSVSMLKLSLLFPLSLTLLHKVNAQPSVTLQTNPSFVFSNVVIADSAKKEFLFQNAKKWITTLAHGNENMKLDLMDSIEGRIVAKSSYFVYSQTGILKKISGTVNYRVSIEVKDNKYRYEFSDFVFHYYKQNRYYNMVETKEVKPLAEPNALGWQKLWESHRLTTFNKMKEHTKELEIKMIEKPELASEKVVAKKIEW